MQNAHDAQPRQKVSELQDAPGRNDHSEDLTPQKRTRWYKSQKISGLSFAFVLMLWLTSGLYVVGQLGTVQTRLILKREGCAYMHHLQMTTQPYDDASGMCTTTIPFRSNLIGNGGVFKLADGELNVAENQIVATEKLHLPYRDSQKRMIALICINTSLVFAALAWIVFCLL